MGLIAVEMFFVSLLTVIAVFLFVNRKAVRLHIFFATLSALLFSISIAASLFLLYIKWVSPLGIITRVMLLAFLAFMYLAFTFVVDFPARRAGPAAKLTLLPLFIFGGFIVFRYIEPISWNVISGFTIPSQPLFGIPATTLFVVVFTGGLSILYFAILLIKAIQSRNMLYRQQLLLAAVGWAVNIIFLLLLSIINSSFSWAFTLMPIGIILLLAISMPALSLTAVYDATQTILSVIRFLVFTLIFALIAGFIAAWIITNIYLWEVGLIYLAVISFPIFLLRSFVYERLGKFFGASENYANSLEQALQALDYTIGREELLAKFVAIMTNTFGCKSLDVLILDDQETFETIFSNSDHSYSFESNTQAFSQLLNDNVSVLLKSQALTAPQFAAIKTELIGFFNRTGSTLIMLIREGQQYIGAFGIGPRINGSEYTAQDVDVLQNLYSYYFLVTYYLRNIAKQDVMLIVDREVEMSDQIIGSIQKNLDIIHRKDFTIGSVSRSARRIGGDFIDLIKLADNRHMFLIGDIAGKGLSAGMSTVIVKSAIHSFLEETKDFKQLVAKTNRFIKDHLPREAFFAGVFGLIDFSRRTVYYINCGIPLMQLYVKNYNNTIEVQGSGRILGFVKNITPFLQVRKVVMNPGDVVVCTTDGLLESTDLRGVPFGNNRVAKILTAQNAASPQEIADALYRRLTDFVPKEPEDDVSIFVLKYESI